MFNVNDILQTGGLLAVGLIIFAESGILLGLFLPGDTLLLTAGLFAGQGKLPLGWLLAVAITSAIAGYEFGYIVGERAGPKLFKRQDGILLRADYIDRTQRFLGRYGAITVLIARFIAHIRTFVSLIAGAGKMNRREYFMFNVLGAILWGGGLTLLGYWVGSSIPHVDRYFFPALVILLVIIYLVIFWEIAKSPDRRRSLRKGLKEDWDYFVRGSRKS